MRNQATRARARARPTIHLFNPFLPYVIRPGRDRPQLLPYLSYCVTLVSRAAVGGYNLLQAADATFVILHFILKPFPTSPRRPSLHSQIPQQ
jgi:hypothetical protein